MIPRWSYFASKKTPQPERKIQLLWYRSPISIKLCLNADSSHSVSVHYIGNTPKLSCFPIVECKFS